jgi:hypothetical protein
MKCEGIASTGKSIGAPAGHAMRRFQGAAANASSWGTPFR